MTASSSQRNCGGTRCGVVVLRLVLPGLQEVGHGLPRLMEVQMAWEVQVPDDEQLETEDEGVEDEHAEHALPVAPLLRVLPADEGGCKEPGDEQRHDQDDDGGEHVVPERQRQPAVAAAARAERPATRRDCDDRQEQRHHEREGDETAPAHLRSVAPRRARAPSGDSAKLDLPCPKRRSSTSTSTPSTRSSTAPAGSRTLAQARRRARDAGGRAHRPRLARRRGRPLQGGAGRRASSRSSAARSTSPTTATRSRRATRTSRSSPRRTRATRT